MGVQPTQYDAQGRPILSNGGQYPGYDPNLYDGAPQQPQYQLPQQQQPSPETEVVKTGAQLGASYAGSQAAGAIGMPLALPAAAAAGTYLAGKSIYDSLQGKEDKSTQGKFGRAQAAFSTMGGSELLKAMGFGHSKNYYEGKTRKEMLHKLFDGKPETANIGGQIYNFSDEKDGTRGYKMTEGPALNAGVQYFKPIAMTLLKQSGQVINKKNVDDLTRILYNEVSADGKVTEQELRDKTLGIIQHYGWKPSQITGVLEEGKAAGYLSDGEAQQFNATINSLKPGGKPLTYDKAIASPATEAAPQPAPQNVQQMFKPAQGPLANPAPMTPPPTSPLPAQAKQAATNIVAQDALARFSPQPQLPLGRQNPFNFLGQR